MAWGKMKSEDQVERAVSGLRRGMYSGVWACSGSKVERRDAGVRMYHVYGWILKDTCWDTLIGLWAYLYSNPLPPCCNAIARQRPCT